MHIQVEKFVENDNFSSDLNIFADWAPEFAKHELNVSQEGYFQEIQGILQSAQFNVINFEMALGHKPFQPYQKSGVKLIAPPERIDFLRNLNFNIFCLANNHITDNSSTGVELAINEVAKRQGIPIGAGSKKTAYEPAIIKVNDLDIAIFNAGESEEASIRYQEIGSADLYSPELDLKITKLKEQGFFIILSSHAGVEFSPSPTPYLIDRYRELVERGVDLICGHHPHVVQGYEIYQGSPIFYSMGNFGLFRPKSRQSEKFGFFISLKITPEKVTVTPIPYEIGSNQIQIYKGDKLKEIFKKIESLSSFIYSREKNLKFWSYYESLFRFRKVISLFSSYFLDERKAKNLTDNHKSQYFNNYIIRDFKLNKSEEEEFKDLLKSYGALKPRTLYELLVISIAHLKLPFRFLHFLYKPIQKFYGKLIWKLQKF